MMKKRNFRKVLLVIFIIALGELLFAGTTGRLAGKIVDENKKPIPFASVLLEGTQIGAQSNAKGFYIIINIPPGKYTVIVQQMGYQTKKIKRVKMKADKTTIKDITLIANAIEIDGFVVEESEIEQVSATKTSSGKTLTSESIEDLGVDDIDNIIALQAGVSQVDSNISVRGGRRNGVSYSVDGMSDRASDGKSQTASPRVKSKRKISSGFSNTEAPTQFDKISKSYSRIELESLRNSESITSQRQNFNTEDYDRIHENEFLDSKENPISTFSIDVDAASYTNCRRFLNRSNRLPPKDAVRIEEFINYFDYDYPQPKGKHPFSITTEYSDCPWNNEHKLVHIGLQGEKIDLEQQPPSNLVFLLDVSGSMNNSNKLPLVKKAFKMLVKQLRPEDKVAIVVYAGAAGVVLESTSGDNKEEILKAINRLKAGGSTAGGQGIKLAYKIAKENLIKKGNNRVVLATDGDFNVGTSSTSELVRMMEKKRKDGIFLTILGFGTGNYKDNRMEQIADKGNENYFYIDNLMESKKVLINELGGTLYTIAKDVKIQVEFNPAIVSAYRLIGYENRMLKKEDFNDDTKDAGELGSGHTVTALYEIILVGSDSEEKISKTDELKYQKTKLSTKAKGRNDLLTVKFRYKKPKGDKSILFEQVLKATPDDIENTSETFRFASSVAEFGLLLRDSKFKKNASFKNILSLAQGSKGKDQFGYRAEFIRLVEMASLLADLERR